MVQEKQLKELFKYIEANWDVCVSQIDKTDIKRIFGGVLTDDIMNDTLHEVKAEAELNEIERAYEEGKKIRRKDWLQRAWIQKLSETESTSDTLTTFSNNWDFSGYPEKWEIYTEPTEQPQPELNEIEQAYERGEKIRHKRWIKGEWLKKYTQISSIDSYGRIDELFTTRLIETPSDWELYTEPEVAHKQSSSQAKLDNSFDRERFERVFCAVTISLPKETWDYTIQATQRGIDKLDAYYASKKGGNNG